MENLRLHNTVQLKKTFRRDLVQQEVSFIPLYVKRDIGLAGKRFFTFLLK
jgi:hypothetical protein